MLKWIGTLELLLTLHLAVGTRLLAEEAPSISDRANLQDRARLEQADAVTLYRAAAEQYAQGRLDDAGYYFYLAQLRARVDLAAYPAMGKGGDDPAVALAAIRLQLGAVLNPAFFGDRELFARIVARLEKWTPTFDPKYDPGWEYRQPVTKSHFDAAVVKVRPEWLAPAQEICALMSDDEYYRLFKLVRDHHVSSARVALGETTNQADETPQATTEAEYSAALERLKQIEKEHGAIPLLYQRN